MSRTARGSGCPADVEKSDGPHNPHYLFGDLAYPAAAPYAETMTRAVHLTGADLVGVPAGITVEGVYAVKLDGGKYPMLGDGNAESWAKGGYDAAVHPISDVDMPAGAMGEWWLVAKIIPKQTGLMTIQGIEVSYESGSRSGSTFYPQQAATNCTR